MMNVMMAIIRSPLLPLHQLQPSLRTQTHLLRLHLHPRQSPQPVVSQKPMTLRRRRRLRLPRLRLQLTPRPSRRLRLPPRKPVAAVVAATCTRVASTYLRLVLFDLLTVSC
jgi:hypothetical protein